MKIQPHYIILILICMHIFLQYISIIFVVDAVFQLHKSIVMFQVVMSLMMSSNSDRDLMKSMICKNVVIYVKMKYHRNLKFYHITKINDNIKKYPLYFMLNIGGIINVCYLIEFLFPVDVY